MTKDINIKKTVYTFSYLRTAAWVAYNQGCEKPENSILNFMNAQLCCAFCLEAYLNHLGQEVLPFWETIERKLNPREKLDVITQQNNILITFGKRPFQTFKEIFDYRNLLVHGKTKTFIYNGTMDENEIIPKEDQTTKWLKITNRDKAKRFLDDCKDMIFYLQNAFEKPEGELYMGEDIDFLY